MHNSCAERRDQTMRAQRLAEAEVQSGLWRGHWVAHDAALLRPAVDRAWKCQRMGLGVDVNVSNMNNLCFQ